MNLKVTTIPLIFLVLTLICCSNVPSDKPVELGLDVLQNNQFSVLKDKRVGVITNQTGVDSKNRHIADILHSAEEVNLVALFGPEHGIRGDIEGGYTVSEEVDEKTGVPVYSLYGDTRKPTQEMLKNIDVLVFDIQDVGTRFYTYISTMSLAMEAAAENDISFVVLDRPNPITGKIVEGPVLKPGFTSFVGIHPIALRHGMTVGELAMLFNGERFFKDSVKVDLTVIKMKNWDRQSWYGDLVLQWIRPSPNIPDPETALLYAGIGLLEASLVSEGRGTSIPFKNIGAPWLNAVALSSELDKLTFEGISFDTTSYVPADMPGAAVNPKFEGTKCNGLLLSVTNPNTFQSVKFGVHLICLIKKMHRDYFGWRSAGGIDRMAGTDEFRKAVDSGVPAEKILASFEPDLEKFMAMRSKYLLYE
ncbi:DUF1343 domain-containing protein [candidate division KSB1 bacterium]|nr:DUF1343 domain-containing protein [candidate division KSB1 bacterium]